jgi:hypothetical protein
MKPGRARAAAGATKAIGIAKAGFTDRCLFPESLFCCGGASIEARHQSNPPPLRDHQQMTACQQAIALVDLHAPKSAQSIITS